MPSEKIKNKKGISGCGSLLLPTSNLLLPSTIYIHTREEHHASTRKADDEKRNTGTTKMGKWWGGGGGRGVEGRGWGMCGGLAGGGGGGAEKESCTQ